MGNLGWGCAPNTDSLDEAWRDPRFPLFHLTGVRRHRVPLPPTLFPTRRSPRASLLPLLQNQDVISSLTANPKPPWLGRSRPTRQACPPRVRTQLNLTKLKKIKKKIERRGRREVALAIAIPGCKIIVNKSTRTPHQLSWASQ